MSSGRFAWSKGAQSGPIAEDLESQNPGDAAVKASWVEDGAVTEAPFLQGIRESLNGLGWKGP